jgi:hypothetical protein
MSDAHNSDRATFTPGRTKATGQGTALDPEPVEGCLQVVEPQADLLKGSGMFATDVERPPDADPQTRLLALLGRRD